MKAAPFEYARPDSVADACGLLARYGADAKLIAGGQSLVPMMAMRLARPAWLVDIARIAALQEIAAGDEMLAIGAATRQCLIEKDARVRDSLPLLPQALAWVGHAQTRNRGTVGGSIVHADPAAEIPLVACALDATLELRDADGATETPAREFFLAPMVTSIAPEQCLVRIRFPIWNEKRTGSAFEEVSIRHGDFALVSACAQVALDESGRVTRATIAIGGAAPVPQALPEIANQLVGSVPDPKTLRDIAAAAAGAIDPEGDLHASARYRRHLARVLAERALVKAVA